MTNQNNHQPTNFWFGFAFGALSAAGVAYFLGTKKGRAKLQTLIEMSENIDLNSPELIREVQSTFMNMLGQDGEVATYTPEEATMAENDSFSSMENVMSKIKDASQTKKYVKKFFFKRDK